MYNNKKMIIAVMCIAVLLMAVGYAAFSTVLTINGTANISSSWKVEFAKIEKVTANTTSGATELDLPTAIGTKATFNVGLQSPGDKIEYMITVSNLGSLDAVINDITASETGSDAIVFEIKNIKIGDKLSKQTSTTFNVIIKYDESITSQPTITTNELTIDIDYIQDMGQFVPQGGENPIIMGQQTVCDSSECFVNTLNDSTVVANKIYNVKLAAGEYTLDDTQNVISLDEMNPNNTIDMINIEGEGDSTSIMSRISFMINDAADTNINTLKISNMKFTDKVYFGVPALNYKNDKVIKYIIFENVTFDLANAPVIEGKLDYAVHILGYSFQNIIFRNCTFKNADYGIYTQYLPYNPGVTLTVEDCTFENYGYNAIQVATQTTGTININNNLFRNEVISNRAIRIDAMNGGAVTISNNTFINAQDSDGQVIKASSVGDGVSVTLKANNWGTLENTQKGMFVGDVLTYTDSQ